MAEVDGECIGVGAGSPRTDAASAAARHASSLKGPIETVKGPIETANLEASSQAGLGGAIAWRPWDRFLRERFQPDQTAGTTPGPVYHLASPRLQTKNPTARNRVLQLDRTAVMLDEIIAMLSISIAFSQRAHKEPG